KLARGGLNVHAGVGGACEGPARTAPRAITTVKKLEQASGRDASRGGAARGASGGAIAGATEVQWAQHKCSILALWDAGPSLVPAPPAPWQMALIGSDPAIPPPSPAPTPPPHA